MHVGIDISSTSQRAHTEESLDCVCRCSPAVQDMSSSRGIQHLVKHFCKQQLCSDTVVTMQEAVGTSTRYLVCNYGKNPAVMLACPMFTMRL